MNCIARALPETKSRAARIRADMKRAGDYQPLAYQRLAAIRYVGMMASLIVFGTLTICVSPQSEPPCLAALALGMFGRLVAARVAVATASGPADARNRAGDPGPIRHATRLREPGSHGSRRPRDSQPRTTTDPSGTCRRTGDRLPTGGTHLARNGASRILKRGSTCPRFDRSLRGSCKPTTARSRSRTSRRSAAHPLRFSERPSRRLQEHRGLYPSRSISVAALRPQAPITPPPGWAALPHR